MRLASIHIKNFRAFLDARIDLDSYTCFVGPNGAGKSTVLAALNIFFKEDSGGQEIVSLSEEDFHQKDTSERIEIELEFADLNEDSREEFADYVRDGRLIVSASAEFDQQLGEARVRQFGKRLAIAGFADFFQALGDDAKTSELIPLYDDICAHYPSLKKARTKPAMRAELAAYEEAHPEERQLLESGDEFYGFAGTGRLAKYLQWVYVPAVKDASTEGSEEKNTALGRLLLRTARREAQFEEGLAKIRERSQAEFERLLEENQSSLDTLAGRLSNRMIDWAHPDAGVRLEWIQDGAQAVRIANPIARVVGLELGFEGDLSRFGHGFQRSYLLALLQELATGDQPSGPRLLLGCEEPELYQHPPQARHLVSVFVQLAERDTQVLVSTHSPLFVVGEHFESVRMVRRTTNRGSEVSSVSFASISKEIAIATGKAIVKPEGTMSRLHQCFRPMASEMFFASRVVLVEGYEDAAYLTAYLELSGRLQDFRRIGAHIVPIGMKSQLPHALATARLMNIPAFVVFDADGGDEKNRELHRENNEALLRMCRQGSAKPFPDATFLEAGIAMWTNNIGDTAGIEIGDPLWERSQSEADRVLGFGGSMKKHSLHIAAKLAHAWDNAGRSKSIDAVCTAILDAKQYLD